MSSTVIKSGTNVRHVHGVAFSFESIAQQADQYLQQVRRQADAILAEANRSADEIRRRAEREGRQHAERAAVAELRRQLETLLPALRQAVDAIRDSKPDWLRQWEQSAVHLAAAMAQRITRRLCDRVPEVAFTLVREALELAVGSPRIVVRLHPEDHAALAGEVATLASEIARLAQADIVADPRVSRGGCRVETLYGVIDQTFEAQLARIEEELS